MSQSNCILVALDCPTLDEAMALAEGLATHVGGFKVGLELLTSVGAPQVVSTLRSLGRPIFFDGKFKDIPHTVAGASHAVAKLGVAMFNVHALGGLEMMQAAVTAAAEGAQLGGWSTPKVLAVTILTSMGPKTLQSIGMSHIHDAEGLKNEVVTLAKVALEAGCDGVVASPQEISAIREACGPHFLIVTPGVRPTWATKGDQHRTTTPKDAIAAGADYLVIGRPITQPPETIGGPAEAVEKILAELAQ